jgi:hydrogenase maturation protein HypF
MVERGLNSPRTSSVGRLFDAAASILDLRQRAAFEGQAAMLVELAADAADTPYPYAIEPRTTTLVPPDAAGMVVVDWRPFFAAVLDDVRAGTAVASVAGRVHRTLAAIVVDVARRQQLAAVVLSGGCFQNRLLTTMAVEALTAAGFRAYWHQRVPPNDGGISLGQVAAVAMGIASRADAQG